MWQCDIDPELCFVYLWALASCCKYRKTGTTVYKYVILNMLKGSYIGNQKEELNAVNHPHLYLLLLLQYKSTFRMCDIDFHKLLYSV